MPVGTNFENSTMKTSYSLSSLHQQKDMLNGATAETNKTDVGDVVKPRQCHSLTKQKRGAVESPEASWRRSWGSTASDQNKEFWMALQENYNYIMDNQLIDNCQAANCELSDIANWTLMEFNTQFSDIYSWLNKIQDDITAYKERDNNEPQLQTKYQNNLIRISGALKLFNQQAERLRESSKSQNLEEIDWRVSHLNSKWESVEAALKPTETDNSEVDTDIDNEIECLSKWLKTMEASIQEVDLWVNWSKAKIETKRIEYKSLHQDIEKHGGIVRSVVRRCQQQANTTEISGDAEEDTVDADVAEYRLNAVTDLEQRWYELYLRSHEWQYFIESLAEREPQLEIDYEDVDDESDDRMNLHQIESKSMSTNTEREPTLSLFANENPKFNRSDRKAPNLGTFYFKHEDTEDSDMEKNLPENDSSIENASSASDNEWTYQASTNHRQIALEDTATTTDDDENVQRLVSQAEELLTVNVAGQLSDTSNTVSNKLNRVKMWLERGGAKNNDTSCDASAEEDEDHDDDRNVDESDDSKEHFGVVCLADDSSDELNESIATTCRRQIGQSIAATIGSQNISLDDLGLADQHIVVNASTPKVIMRNKGAVSRVRPLSDFCVSQLSDRICDTSEGLSISESALNRLTLSNKKLNANSMQCVDADKPLNNNSTSSTVEDTTGALFLEDKAGGTRRKRLKSKKKSTLRKSGEITTNSITIRPLIRKSGSFSGQGASVASAGVSATDRHAVSDPSAIHRPYGLGRIGAAAADTTSTTSGVDSDDDKQAQRAPIFRLDLKTNYCYNANNNASLNHPPCSSLKSSLNNGEEQFSSMSEQAWDSFQEKYSSEAYSEAHDSDGARRLQEFDEDYRNYLDSQSDWSCQSTGLGMHQYPPHLQRKQAQQRHQFSPQQIASAAPNASPMNISDRRSGTGTGDVLAMSQFELKELRGVVDSCIAGGPAALKEFNPKIQGELIERCDINLSQLKRVRRTSSRRSSNNSLTQKDKDIAEFALDDTIVADSPETAGEDSAVVTEASFSKTELMALWLELKGRIENIREYRFLDDSIQKLRAIYAQLMDLPIHSELSVSSTEDVSMKIDIYSSERGNLDEKKKVLLELNVAVHRFCTEHKEYDSATFCLQSAIAELYRISDDLYTSNNDKLHKLTNLLQLWKVLEMRLDQLCGDLRDDEHTLGILDCAFEEGTFDQQMAVSARGVAKLLSETKLQNIPALFVNTNIVPISLTSMMLDGGASTCGGSFSDSGISDEGSEHEPGERERRLAAIRRLVRQLEHIISPDSIANIRMQERLTFAEEELMTLRSRCRLLMTKSGAALDVPESPVRKPAVTLNIKTRKPNGDPDDNPRPLSWYRRIMRASIPFQLALVALVCLVFLLKPQCCDNMNTYTLFLQPQVHYTRGPPPT